MSDDYGANTIVTTVETLSERLLGGLVAWMLHGRGAEGMTMDEIMAGLKRQVPVRWLAVFVHDPDYAIKVLGYIDPENTVLDTRDGDAEDEIWRLPLPPTD